MRAPTAHADLSGGLGPLPAARLARNAMLARFTTWRVGGPADLLAEPTAAEIVPLIAAARDAGLPVTLIGRGSNLLIRDTGVRGLVITLRKSMKGLAIGPDEIVAEAGAPLPQLARLACEAGLEGFAFLAGIPGTVGGGIALNAGLTAHGREEIAEVLAWVEALCPDGQVRCITDIAALGLEYRSSRVGVDGLVLLRAGFRVGQRAPASRLLAQLGAHLAERKRKQPLDKATAGSTFKQPPGGKSAGWYIEQAGLKTARVGGAMVSPKHANWIENDGTARAADIAALMAHIVATVQDRFGVTLEPEVHSLG